MDEEKDNEIENKVIEIVKGSPKDLNISDVKDNLAFEVHDNEERKNIIIPENQKNSDSKESED